MKNFIFKLTPNNKTVIINTSVLINGYEDVEYPIPFKQTTSLGYVLDPQTFKFSDASTMQKELNAYPINMEIETIFDPVPFYGQNNHRSTSEKEICIFYFSPYKINGNDVNTNNNILTSLYNIFKFVQVDNHDEITFEPYIPGKYIVDEIENYPYAKGYKINEVYNYFSVNYKIIIKIYWSDDKSHAEELNANDLTNIIPSIGTYCLDLNITPHFLDDSTASLQDENITYLRTPENYIKTNNTNVFYDLINKPFIKIFDTPSDILYDRDIIMFDIAVTFTDPTTQLSIITNKSVVVQQKGFIGKRKGYVHLKQVYLDPIDVWSPTVQETFVKSIDNEANPKVDVTSETEYCSFNINSSFIIDIDNYNYTHIFMHDILPYPTLTDLIECSKESDDEDLQFSSNDNDDKLLELLSLMNNIDETSKNRLNKFIKNYIKQYNKITDKRSKGNLKYNDIVMHHYYKDIDLLDPSLYSLVSDKDYVDFKNRFNKCKKLDDSYDNDNIYQLPNTSETWDRTIDLNNDPKKYLETIENNKSSQNNQDEISVKIKEIIKKHICINQQYISLEKEQNNLYKIEFDFNLPKLTTTSQDSEDTNYQYNIKIYLCYDFTENKYKFLYEKMFTDNTSLLSDNEFTSTDNKVYLITHDIIVSTGKPIAYFQLLINEKSLTFKRVSYDGNQQVIISTDILKLNFALEDSNVILTHNVYKFEINAKYRARYAKYFINDETYKQIFTKKWNNETYYYDSVDDLDCQNFDDVNSSEGFRFDLNNNKKNIINYKLKTAEDGKAIQYKYCVNNLFNTFIENGEERTIQVPRFGVYPVLEGYVPFMFETFNYKDSDDFPIEDYPKNEVDNIENFFNTDIFKHQVLKKNSQGIWYIDTSILSDGIKQNITTNANTNQFNVTSNLTNVVSQAQLNNITQNVSSQNTQSQISSQTTNGTSTNNMIFGTENNAVQNYTITISFKDSNNINLPQIFENNGLRINGVKYSKLNLIKDNLIYKFNFDSQVNPYIFTISLDEFPKDLSTCLNINITDNNEQDLIHGSLLLTNDENEKHITHYLHEGKDINTDHNTFMLLRANPKLSGNVKLVVDSQYNLYLDTFKVSSKLNDYRLRKYPISAEGNYPRDIKKVFKDLPTNELYKVPENSLKAHKVYTDFNDQYDTIYEYGAETNKDNLYDENMKILAPLHIGKDIPQFFAIFRYDDVFNIETYNGNKINDINKFRELITKSKVIKTFDLREYTSIGQYLNNYKNTLTNYGQCYLQFIEQDYDIQSRTYRQGNNIWKGISIKRGILTDQSESSYFAARILNDETITNKQEVFNNFIMKGFERNNLLYPNIINLEFMFNDIQKPEYSMHRYFGLYLSENDFINYGYIISTNLTYNNVFDKYDVNGNIYEGDRNLYNSIFTNLYKDRIFYAITNDYAERVSSEIEINNFLSKYVKNLPETNLTTIKGDNIVYEKTDRSFITLHFTKPIKYGEHFKFIAMNRITADKSYFNSELGNHGINPRNKIPYDHIVYEIIASNDENLRYTDYNISPYVNTQTCIYSENTYFFRMSFYTQDVAYPEIEATLAEQIRRINACIEKFDTFIKVQSFNNISLSVIADHDEMYFQHIDAVDLNDFKYDYINWDGVGENIYSTNDVYTDSISYLLTDNSKLILVNEYEQIEDEYNTWLTGVDFPVNPRNSDDKKIWKHYVETSDPRNIKEDSISYFNKDVKYKMFALTNQSDYFDGYYAAFSNYCFETLGWRYNNIVKFINVKNLSNSYVLYDDIYKFIKDVKFPIILNDADQYETLNIFNIEYGYLRNNIYDPDFYEAFTTIQQLIYDNQKITAITSPYNVNYSMICTTGQILLKNNAIQLYKPKYANIAIMGISNIKDLDTIINLDRINHQETNLTITLPADETIKIDESDYRIQHGVMYQLISNKLYYDDENYIPKNDKFIIIKDNEDKFKLYSYSIDKLPIDITNLMSKSEVIYKICDKQFYQDYNYDTIIPSGKTDNFYIDLNNLETSELVYPIVPLVQCNWKSNGQYFDYNNVLDVSLLNKNYTTIGSFVENTYTPSDYNTNQYITNKIDNVLFVDDIPMSFKDCILTNAVQHPIKQLLIDNTNIEPAAAYYNSNTQSLEFIFSGIKFNIKLNSKIVNTFIHLDEYTGFDVFVLNDYDLSKRNELYISQYEKFILLINHQFYIDYEHEAVSNIKNVTQNDFSEYVDYSVFKAPYSIDFKTTMIMNIDSDDIQNGDIMTHKKTNNFTKSLYDTIDKHNLWSSMFIQYDVPVLNNIETETENEPQFIQSYMEAINEFNNYITFDRVKSEIGLLELNTVIASENIQQALSTIYSYDYPFVITKADGNYNHIAYQLLNNINNKLLELLDNEKIKPNALKKYDNIKKERAKIEQQKINGLTPQIIDDGGIPVIDDGGLTPAFYGRVQAAPNKNTSKQDIADANVNKDDFTEQYNESQKKQIQKNVTTSLTTKNYEVMQDLIIFAPQILTDMNISINEELLNIRYELNNDKDSLFNQLSKLQNNPLFTIMVNPSNISRYENIIIPKKYLTELQNYINILITSETPREKLERYVKTFDDNIDIYIIPVHEEVKYIKNTNEYNPLIFELSIPNRIKYNYGWFTPNTNNMVDFYVNDELRDILDVDLLQANTRIKDIHKLLNYTGNKVFDDNVLYNLYQNYFIIPERSLLSSTWDTDYYRKYTSENNYTMEEGHITGIDDKSFFGSKCMVIRHNYIELGTWVFDTANDIFTVSITDSKYNTQESNTKTMLLTINLSSALYNHFINNEAFKENWNYFKDSQYTGMKNYINNTITTSYNMNSNIEIILYAIYKNDNEDINIIVEKPENLELYTIYEGYSTSLSLENNIYTLKINIPKTTGMDIYPTIKIYRK